MAACYERPRPTRRIVEDRAWSRLCRLLRTTAEQNTRLRKNSRTVRRQLCTHHACLHTYMRTLKTWLRWLWKRFRTGQTPESLFFLFENTMSESGLATKSGLGARARDNGRSPGATAASFGGASAGGGKGGAVAAKFDDNGERASSTPTSREVHVNTCLVRCIMVATTWAPVPPASGAMMACCAVSMYLSDCWHF